jgi:hypothetical protein
MWCRAGSARDPRWSLFLGVILCDCGAQGFTDSESADPVCGPTIVPKQNNPEPALSARFTGDQDQLPECAAGASPVALASDAVGGIALDADAIYYGAVGGPRAVSKDGATSVWLGPGDGPVAIAVDEQHAYWSGYNSWLAPKQGCAPEPLFDGTVVAVAAGDGAVYFSDWGVTSPAVRQWQGTDESLVALDLNWGTKLLVRDGYLYVAAFGFGGMFPVTRMSLADSVSEEIGSLDTARGLAVTNEFVFAASEGTRSIERFGIASHDAKTVLSFAGYPTGLASYGQYVYVSLQELDPESRRYAGRLVRFGLDGADPCVLGAPADFGDIVAADADGVYWVGSRTLWALHSD